MLKRLLIVSTFAVAGLSQAQVVIQPGSNWSGSGIYDFTHKLACAGADLRVYTFTKVFGQPKLTLDLHSFLGTTKGGAMVEGLTLGKTFFLANQAFGYIGIGGDQIAGFSHPGFSVSAGLYVQF